MGGRCFDKWGYRWGQRADDVWLYMILPDGLSVTDLRVTFKPHQLGIFVKDVALYDGELWNVGERKGIDADSSTWSVETEGQFSVLHIEMFKVKSGWWKAVWAGHPTIEPWEVPDWKSATFSDGYRSLN